MLSNHAIPVQAVLFIAPFPMSKLSSNSKIAAVELSVKIDFTFRSLIYSLWSVFCLNGYHNIISSFVIGWDFFLLAEVRGNLEVYHSVHLFNAVHHREFTAEH